MPDTTFCTNDKTCSVPYKTVAKPRIPISRRRRVSISRLNVSIAASFKSRDSMDGVDSFPWTSVKTHGETSSVRQSSGRTVAESMAVACIMECDRLVFGTANWAIDRCYLVQMNLGVRVSGFPNNLQKIFHAEAAGRRVGWGRGHHAEAAEERSG